MTPESPVFKFLSHPLTGVTVTFLATLVCSLLLRLDPGQHRFWQEAKGRPGQALAAATVGTSLAAAFPRLVYELPVATCEGGVCRALGVGYRVIEGTGFGAFVQQFLLSAALDVPAGVFGGLLGFAIARATRAQRDIN